MSVTHGKQTVDNFFQALGRWLPWGTKQYFTNDSIDARLFGCAYCGMKEYDNSDDFTKMKIYQFIPLESLKLLKLSNEDSHEYQKNLKVKLILPINENGCCNIFIPWKAKSVFY